MTKPAFTIEQNVKAHRATTFEHFLSADLRRNFRAGFFVPGIAGVYPKGSWSKPGDQRIISLENGRRIVCSLEAVVRDKTLTYSLRGFSVLGVLIRAVDIRLDFEKDGINATNVRMFLEFTPRGQAGCCCLKLLLLPFLRAYFRRALAAASRPYV